MIQQDVGDFYILVEPISFNENDTAKKEFTIKIDYLNGTEYDQLSRYIGMNDG